MANQNEIEKCYDAFDPFFALSLGASSDITCAFFNGDFSKTLEQAQRDKHEWVLDGLGFKEGDRIIDVGCGKGPMLQAIKENGGYGIGLTLSPWQAQHCKQRGLDARVQDYKTANPETFGKIDGIVSIGALEHFCSINEFKAGKQDQVYRDFFKFCANVLPKGKKLYLHMMVWGKRVPNPDDLTMSAPEDSEELILARASKFYPGSWLPTGKNQLVECAKPYFNFLSSNNGRLDYIETLNRWGTAAKSLYKTRKILPTAKIAIKLLPIYLTSPDFRAQVEFLRKSDQKACFQREIMSHERMFFEKA